VRFRQRTTASHEPDPNFSKHAVEPVSPPARSAIAGGLQSRSAPSRAPSPTAVRCRQPARARVQARGMTVTRSPASSGRPGRPSRISPARGRPGRDHAHQSVGSAARAVPWRRGRAEPPRVRWRLRSLRSMESCRDRASTRTRSASARCGWCWITSTSTDPSGRRSARWPRSWARRPRPCGCGSAELRPMRAAGQGRPATSWRS
jgi:hypothetical protein